MSFTAQPRRILIAGVSGVGKTTLAKHVASALSIEHTEIDGLYHGPNWTPRQEFLEEVKRLAGSDCWVTEWQYQEARPVLLARADQLVWLDLPRRQSLFRVIRRTWQRSRSREVLWNGNREPGMVHALVDREGIIRWALSSYGRFPEKIAAAQSSYPGLEVVRLRSQREVDDWLQRL